MIKKFAKLLGILLAIPIVFGIFGHFANAETCDNAEDCQSLIDSKTEWLQDADYLYSAFSKCIENCGLWDFSDWSMCEVKYGDEEKKCDEIATMAKAEIPGKSDYNEIKVGLGEWKSELGLEIKNLEAQKQSFASIKTQEILAIEGQKSSTDLKTFFDKVIDLLVKMVGLAAFLLLLAGGFRLLIAAGNDNEIQKAKTMITYAIIGLAVALLAYIIVAGAQGILYGG